MTAPNEWFPLSVGCHWRNHAYPQAVVSTFMRYGPLKPGVMRSGYQAVVNFSVLAECATREMAQQAVEAYLGGAP